MIEIWGRPGCGYCEKAKALCESRGLAYTYKTLDVDFTREQIFEEFPGAKTFPQIRVGGKAIGGYTELGRYLEETNYNGTGYTL